MIFEKKNNWHNPSSHKKKACLVNNTFANITFWKNSTLHLLLLLSEIHRKLDLFFKLFAVTPEYWLPFIFLVVKLKRLIKKLNTKPHSNIWVFTLVKSKVSLRALAKVQIKSGLLSSHTSLVVCKIRRKSQHHFTTRILHAAKQKINTILLPTNGVWLNSKAENVAITFKIKLITEKYSKFNGY